jgi:hypothetical protein
MISLEELSILIIIRSSPKNSELKYYRLRATVAFLDEKLARVA